MSSRPIIYLVDNDDQSDFADALKARGVSAEWLYPTEVTEQHLARATLLAIDEYFDLTADAPEEDLLLPLESPTVARPVDGLAVASVLRSASKRVGRTKPLGICLRTGKLDELTTGLPRSVRAPLFAAQHDLEWIVAKGSDEMAAASDLVDLALSLAQYPPGWSSASAHALGVKWLSVPNESWHGDAIAQISLARPPVEVSPSSSHGLAWLRWLAQKALPYPTFVLSEVRAATVLGITLESFRAVLDTDEPFAQRLRACIYRGPLSELFAPRFWRAGIEEILTDAKQGEAFLDDVEASARLVATLPELEPLGIEFPVVCIDRDYSDLDQPQDRDDALRLTPDSWPAYADAAWGSEDHIEDGGLRDLLAPKLV